MRNTIFLPFGLKVALFCEPILVALAITSGIGCLRKSKLAGRVIGSILAVALILYYAVTSIASLKLAWSPIQRIISLEGLLGPTLVYGVILFLLNTRLKSCFEPLSETSA